MRSTNDDSSPESSPGEVTSLLAAHREGDESAFERLVDLVYPLLSRIAHDRLRGGGKSVTVSTGDLVHEAYARVLAAIPDSIRDRPTLLCALARSIRNLVVDHHRRRRSAKRGGGWERVNLDGLRFSGGFDDVDQLALREAMDRLRGSSTVGARCHEVVLLRYFAQHDLGEIAEILRVSRRTVDSDWRYARAFLARQLGRDNTGGGESRSERR